MQCYPGWLAQRGRPLSSRQAATQTLGRVPPRPASMFLSRAAFRPLGAQPVREAASIAGAQLPGSIKNTGGRICAHTSEGAPSRPLPCGCRGGAEAGKASAGRNRSRWSIHSRSAKDALWILAATGRCKMQWPNAFCTRRCQGRATADHSPPISSDGMLLTPSVCRPSKAPCLLCLHVPFFS